MASVIRPPKASPKAAPPTWSQTIDPLTNRIVGAPFGYSAGGNLQTTPYSPGGILEYDQLNRLTTVDRVRRFWYDAANRRVWRSDNGIATFTLYGMDGMVLGTFEWKSRFNGFQAEYWVEKRQANRYLGQRLVWQDGKGILTDRLGSVHVRGTTETNTYYPYGEQKTGDFTQDRQKWGTYWRDSATGMDNAVNRWYSPTAGRFSTPDVHHNRVAPQSWNQYSYGAGDPVNSNDPTGRWFELPGGPSIWPPEILLPWADPWDIPLGPLPYWNPNPTPDPGGGGAEESQSRCCVEVRSRPLNIFGQPIFLIGRHSYTHVWVESGDTPLGFGLRDFVLDGDKTSGKLSFAKSRAGINGDDKTSDRKEGSMVCGGPEFCERIGSAIARGLNYNNNKVDYNLWGMNCHSMTSTLLKLFDVEGMGFNLESFRPIPSLESPGWGNRVPGL